MSQQVQAVYSGGVIRPLEKVILEEGEELSVLLLPRQKRRKVNPAETLNAIAALPIEGESDGFTGADHDLVLYPPAEQKQ
ncbi:MAG: antitoxin family protein [Acidobacteriota bacterium]